MDLTRVHITKRSLQVNQKLRDVYHATDQGLAAGWAKYHRELYVNEDGQARVLDVARAAYWQSVAERPPDEPEVGS